MMSDEQRHWRLGRSDALITIGLVVLVAVLFVLFLERPSHSDPLAYFYSSWHIEEIKPTHRALRIGLIWPIWAIMQIFGYSELSYYFVPAVAALLLVLSTWFLGRLLVSRWVGALAAILIIYNPWVLSELTAPMPDYLGAGLFTTAMALLLWCWRAGRLDEAPLAPGTMAVLAMAGLACGWSYLAREFVVILFPLVPLFFYVTRSRYAGLLPIASTALACWVAELLWGALKFGDPFARLHAVSAPRTGWVGMSIETDPIDTISQLPKILLTTPGGLVVVVLLLAGAAFSVVGSARGDPRWRLIAFWLIGGWLFFTTVAMLPVLLLQEGSVYLRMQKFRYWALILPPLFIAGLAFVQYFIRRLGGWVGSAGSAVAQNAALGLASLALIANSTSMVLPAMNANPLARNGGNRDYLEFRKFISEFDGARNLVLLSVVNSARRAIPIYLNSWNGVERMWHGGVKVVREKYLKKLPSDDQKDLIVIDLTRTVDAPGPRYPSDLIEYLDSTFDKRFESSSGYIKAYTWPSATGSRH
jgi:hypothetical protein